MTDDAVQICRGCMVDPQRRIYTVYQERAEQSRTVIRKATGK